MQTGTVTARVRSVRRDVSQVCDELRRRSIAVDAEARFSVENHGLLSSAGLMGLRVPADYGGAGLDIAGLVDVIRNIGGACPSTGLGFLMHSCATSVIAATAGEPVRGRYLSRIADGEIVAYAGTERGTGSNFWALESCAVAFSEGFRLKLRKSWATLAEVADLFVIPTRARPDARPTEISLFLVERREGVEATEPWTGTGMRGSSSGPVDVDAAVPRERLMGTPGCANDYITTDMFNLLLLAHSALYLGVAEEALRLASARMRSRVFAHTGRALADESMWQSRLGALSAETRACRALVRAAAVDADAAYGSRTLLKDALASKLYACGLARRATDATMEIFGGSGYNRGERIELLWRDARAGSLMRPSDELAQMILGRLECGMPPFASQDVDPATANVERRSHPGMF